MLRDLLIWIANNLFNQVAILIGLIVLLGYAIQGKRSEEVVAGALRATIGVLILFIGIDVFVGGLLSFQTVVSSAFHLKPPQATKTLADFLRTNGSTIALIITLGFLIHALLVRFVPFFRYVYLTGHLMFWISVVVAATLVEAFPKITPAALVLWGSIIVAVYWSVQPMYIARYMRKVIGSDDYGFGHTSSAGCYLAARLAPYVGSKEKYDTERLRLPRRLAFFKDVNASTALVIGVIMLLAMLFADKALVADQAKKFNATIDPWGWRGAALGGVINGLFLAIGQATAWGLLSHTAPELATLGDPDWYIIIWVLRAVLSPFKS